MLKIKAKKRELIGKKIKKLRKQGILPGVLYGPKIKNLPLEINLKDFEKTYKEAGESSLVSLEVEGKEYSALIHQIKRDPLTGQFLHVDFYQPILTEKVEATVPLVFEGESKAVKDLGGTLIREIQEIVVKALPQDLPHEIKVNIEKLETFEDEILVKDLKLSDKVEAERKPEDIVALISPPEKVEEELEKPVEEKEEQAEQAEEEKEEAGEKEEKGKKEQQKNKKVN